MNALRYALAAPLRATSCAFLPAEYPELWHAYEAQPPRWHWLGSALIVLAVLSCAAVALMSSLLGAGLGG